MIAVVGGTRKNKFDVFEAEPILIKYIRIVKAPKETIIICQDIDKINEPVKFMYETSKSIETTKRKIAADIAW